MAILPIIIAPDPRLKVATTPVEIVDDTVRQLMHDMVQTMYQANGIGLAAPQVGATVQVVVVDIAGEDEKPQPICMANPEVIWTSDELHTYEEGCLSLPEQYSDVTRPERVRIRYIDEENEIRELDADGILATCLQHEIDHLDGTLFVDHVSPLKRNMILRKLQKSKKQGPVAKYVTA